MNLKNKNRKRREVSHDSSLLGVEIKTYMNMNNNPRAGFFLPFTSFHSYMSWKLPVSSYSFPFYDAFVLKKFRVAISFFSHRCSPLNLQGEDFDFFSSCGVLLDQWLRRLCLSICHSSATFLASALPSLLDTPSCILVGLS